MFLAWDFLSLNFNLFNCYVDLDLDKYGFIEWGTICDNCDVELGDS